MNRPPRIQAPNLRVLRTPSEDRKLRIYTRKHIDSMPRLGAFSPRFRNSIKAVSTVLPFRVNRYVVEELIDWSSIPDDPMFQLTFPQPEMLEETDFRQMYELIVRRAPASTVQAAARRIQRRMNPHPAGQLQLNVPTLHGERLEGMQHKYRETVLFFPAAGQTCHSYCTYCFRWAQFVGIDELKFASRQARSLVAYLERHPEVTDVLFTGGDPMVMKTSVLRKYIQPLLDRRLEHVQSIRIGTKAPAYWPHRFVTDPDADDLLRLFEEVRRAGRNLALMAHYSHPRELSTPMAAAAVRRIRKTGAVVRTQAPMVRRVNDSPEAWSQLWNYQVRMGAVPYYMFVERDTGPKNYFEVPLTRALDIYNEAFRKVSGLSRTVRGPSMSATPGKVLVDGVATIRGRRVFVLKFLQARDPEWVGRPFFAEYDTEATWLSGLTPAFGEREFFYERGMRRIKRSTPVA